MIRTATTDDLALVRELWHAFEREVPEPVWRDDDSEDDLRKLEKAIGKDIVLLADNVGLAVATKTGQRAGMLDILFVRPRARGKGVADELVREVAEQLRAQGVGTLELEVLATNSDARAIYERWGFAPVELTLAAPIEALVERLGHKATGPTFGSIHVQTDDAGSVERDVQKALPRMGHSDQTTVSGAHNGWVSVRDELCDRDPTVLQRLGKELSYTSGGVVLALGVEEGVLVKYTLYDRGAAVDEYASVPEFRGPLPPGDVIALGANPTVVARLTGADPARVREIARTAASPSDLPPALELLAQIAELMGVQI
ncbi:MAG TPA: GNAT family N-acetyltransferase [Gaiellaceae bacterium]